MGSLTADRAVVMLWTLIYDWWNSGDQFDEVELKELLRDCAALAQASGATSRVSRSEVIEVLRSLRPERVYEDAD